MPTDIRASDPLIDTLVADLLAVRPRRWLVEAALLIGLVAAEVLIFVILRGVRPDLTDAMAGAAFWWKSGGLVTLALLAAVAALVSLDPATTTSSQTRTLWRAIVIAVPLLLGLGWIIDAGASGQASLRARLDWREGLDCLRNITLLSLLPVLALGLFMRRGAATRPGRTARAIGLSAATFGAFIFAFHCNHDDPLYIAIWYGGAIALVTALAGLLLPRLTRW